MEREEQIKLVVKYVQSLAKDFEQLRVLSILNYCYILKTLDGNYYLMRK